MPRPGPRPYECVRRAWHSDRHQPMRGSIIQQIFRVVHARHTSGTKKNREWQEKLPCVVLKSEEIMYSKANSEAEYMDLETLWDRVNEAINTIIRRDESTESGDLLPPCVEAALNLGCVPVRASRSQRHNTPRSYLSVRTHESGCVPPTNLDTSTNQQSPTLPPLHSPNPSPVERPVSTNFTCSVSESSRHVMQKDKNIPSPSSNFPSSYKKFPFPDNSHNSHHFIPVENNASVNAGCVYPLYSGTHFQPRPATMGLHPPKSSNTIIVGTPIFQTITEPAEMGCLQNFFYRDGDPNALNKTIQADFRDNHEKAPDVRDCDLSLRLGLSSTHDAADFGPSGSHYGEKLTDISPPRNKEFSFFPTEIGNEPFGFSTRNISFMSEVPNVEEAIKKRKAPYNENVENDRFFWQPESSSNQISSRLKRPGL